MKKGFTLIEILVVITIFAFLGILITRSILLSITGSKKSESIVKVRTSLDYAMGVMERQLRNADGIPTLNPDDSPNCPNTDTSVLNYTDQYGNLTSFSCQSNGNVQYMASGSAQLTGSDINLKTCEILCSQSTGVSPAVVTINLEGEDVTASGIQGADVSLSTQVSLRNYGQ